MPNPQLPCLGRHRGVRVFRLSDSQVSRLGRGFEFSDGPGRFRGIGPRGFIRRHEGASGAGGARRSARAGGEGKPSAPDYAGGPFAEGHALFRFAAGAERPAPPSCPKMRRIFHEQDTPPLKCPGNIIK